MAAKDYTTEVERLRRKIRATQVEVEDLELGRRTLGEAKQRIGDWVDREAARVNSFQLVASATVDGPLETAAFHQHAGESLAGYLCWLDPERMKQQLSAELEAHADELCSDTPAKDRAVALKKAQTELAKLEREEERLIVEAQTAGISIERRPDVTPEVILEIAS